MRFLERERQTLDAYLPGLDDALGAMSLAELETPGCDAIARFRDAGGPGLLIPRDYGGLGASARDAIQVQRAIGSRSPSLAVATTMHHFSVATLIEMCAAGSGLEWLLVEAIAKQRLLVASGFAEGLSGRGILAPTMRATAVEGAFRITGSKKPCSLSRSMDLLTVSASLDDDEFVVALVPASSSGIVRKPFWRSGVLTGAESDELMLDNVEVPDKLVFTVGDGAQLDPIQVAGFMWFELLISASYLGAASALVERALAGGKGDAAERALLAIELEGAASALDGVAATLAQEVRDEGQLAHVLFVRYSTQRAVERATGLAAELLGGMAFISSTDVGYLLAATRALAFHPPSRASISPSLVSYLAGAPLEVQ